MSSYYRFGKDWMLLRLDVSSLVQLTQKTQILVQLEVIYASKLAGNYFLNQQTFFLIVIFKFLKLLAT